MKYLDRYYTHFCDKQIKLQDDQVADIIVVIPSYNESKETLEKCLLSLMRAKQLADDLNIVISLLINHSHKDSQSIAERSLQLEQWIKSQSYNYNLECFRIKFTDKQAGVGLARKLLMDAGFSHFYNHRKDGLIVNLDADSIVSENYFNSIWDIMRTNPNVEAASISFEHYESEKEEENQAIVDYESHLRYFVNMQRLLQLPYAFQTIGSAMVVRAFAYAKEGGMPKKQAGEDFYFLHKFSKNGSLGEINTCTVYPSGRVSERVPFGTGKAVREIINTTEEYKSYNPKSFEVLGEWFKQILNLVHDSFCLGKPVKYTSIDKALDLFLLEIKAKEKIDEILQNASNIDSFVKRFFQWFDAFLLMKYLHFMRDNSYENQSIESCMAYLFERINLPIEASKRANLIELRSYDLKNKYESQCNADLISRLSNISASLFTHQANRE